MIEIDNISFRWGKNAPELFDKFSIKLERNKTIGVLGPSGSGKSTLLRLIAGLSKPSVGTIRFDGDLVTAPSPDRTFVFQDYALFEWLPVVKNVELAMSWAGLSASRSKAIAFLDAVGLADVANSYPRQLSGGMRQRAALARAIAAQPKTILLDEPFSALDLYTRNRVQAEVSRLLESANNGAVLVTHYVDEAIFMADRIVVLGGSPVKVVFDHEVPFEHPRASDLRNTEAFKTFASEVERALFPTEQ